MNDIVRFLLEQNLQSAKIAYGTATALNTVTIEGTATAVELPALEPVVAGDYCAIVVQGADRLILGPVHSTPVPYTGLVWASLGGGTAPALGSGGSLVCYQQRVGDWIDLAFRLTFGTTGLSGGTLQLGFTGLPKQSANVEQIGTAKLYLPSHGDFMGCCQIAASTSTLIIRMPATPTSTIYEPWQSANAGAGAGTGVPQLSGQYGVQQSGNLVVNVRYKVA